MEPNQALYVAWNVADFLLNTNRYIKAIDFYEECFVLLRLTIFHRLERTIPNKPYDIERQLFVGLSEAYSECGFIKKAIEMCKGCLKINKEAGHKRRESGCYENIGRMYFNLGQCKNSISYHEKALAVRETMKEKELEASSLNNLCLVYRFLDQYEKAIEYAEKAFEIGKEIGDRETEGAACTSLSQIYSDLGQYEKAIEYQNKDLKISKEVCDRKGEGTCYNNLGGIYMRLSQYDKCLEYFQRGLQIVQEIGFREGEGSTYLNLAVAYRELGEYAASLEYSEKALAIIRSLRHQEEEGRAYLYQAGIYQTLGDYEKSIECCKQALAITTTMGNKKSQASCYCSFGGVFQKLGQYEESIKCFEQSLKISKEIRDLHGEGVSCNNLACTYYSLGYYESSIEYFEKDLQISKSIGDRYGEGTTLCSIGNSYYALGQLEKSLEYQKRALEIMQEIGSIKGENYVSQHLGASHFAKRNLSEAVHHLTNSINTHEKMRTRLKDEHKLSLDDENISSYRMLCRLLVGLDKPNDALCTLEQGRARGLVDLLSMRYGIQEVSNARTLNLSAMRELFTRQRTNFLFLGTPLGTIMRWFVNRDGEIFFISFNYTDSNGRDLEDHLKELIVSISHSLQDVQCEDRSLDACYGILLPNVSNRSKETAQPEHNKEGGKDKETRLHLLFMMTISPIVDHIDNPEIVIVPEGPLFLIPFSALQVVELCPLPKAREEAQMVSALLGVPCLVGENATKEEVLRRIQEVCLVHIAAHGDAVRGEIALAPNSSVAGIPEKDDFMLTMKDIAEVRIRAKLVVLSCCHSARGKILTAEGVVGIARAFLGSGVRSVLMSLWAVDDEATMAFMEIFYKCLIYEKLSAGEALYQSMKKMRESPLYNDVKHWAPFVLLGDDVKLDLNEET